MTNAQIINYVANSKIVEEIIGGITYSKFENKENLQDLAQDIYLQLLQMDTKKLNDLYCKNQLRYWITRIITNNIHSKTSPYYYQYKKAQRQSVSVSEIDLNDERHRG